MPDVEHFHPLLPFEDSENYSINMRLAAIQKMTKLGAFPGDRAAIRHLFQTEDRCS